MPKQRTTNASIRKVSAKRRNTSGNANKIVLDAIAFVAETFGSKDVSREKMLTFIKAKEPLGKSTIANALTKLKRKGLIIVKPGVVTITPKGMENADASGDMSFTTNESFHKEIKEKFRLPPRQCALFDCLVDGKVHDKKETAAAIGCKINSTWANMLTALKKRGIIEFGRQSINLSNDMFPFGIPDTE